MERQGRRRERGREGYRGRGERKGDGGTKESIERRGKRQERRGEGEGEREMEKSEREEGRGKGKRRREMGDVRDILCNPHTHINLDCSICRTDEAKVHSKIFFESDWLKSRNDGECRSSPHLSP